MYVKLLILMGIFDKGVKKTNEGFFKRLSRAIVGKSRVDDSVLDAIEEALISSDMGVDTTLKIIDNLEERVEKDKFMSMTELTEMLRDEIAKLLDVEGAPERHLKCKRKRGKERKKFFLTISPRSLM